MEEIIEAAYDEMEDLDENEIEELKAKGRRYAVEAVNAMSNAVTSVLEKMRSEDSFVVTASYFETLMEAINQMAPTEECGSDLLNLIGKYLKQ